MSHLLSQVSGSFCTESKIERYPLLGFSHVSQASTSLASLLFLLTFRARIPKYLCLCVSAAFSDVSCSSPLRPTLGSIPRRTMRGPALLRLVFCGCLAIDGRKSGSKGTKKASKTGSSSDNKGAPTTSSSKGSKSAAKKENSNDPDAIKTSARASAAASTDDIISTFPSVDFRDPAATDMTEKAKANLHWLYAHTTQCSFMLVAGDTRGCGIIPEISTPEDYSRLVLKAPRPYHLFVLFTNKGCCNLKRGHCKKDCEKAEVAFKQVAASYHILGEHEAPDGLLDEEGDSSATSASPDPAAASDEIKLELRASAIAEQQPAFFAIVYCDEEAMQQICTAQKPSSGTAGKISDSVHKLDTVPKLVHARGSTLRRKNNAITFKPQHVHQTVDWSQAEEMLSFVSGFAPREGCGRGSSGGGAVKLYEDLVARLRKMAPIVGVGLGVLAIVVLGAGLVRLLPWLMVVGACGVQWLGCSGITYNLIHGMKWHGDRGERISRSNRVQFLTEGLSCSALFMIGGLALVFAITLAQSRYRTRTAANFATLLACLSIGVSFASVWTLLNIYGDYKAGWYVQPGFAPPEGYRMGPVDLDRGLSFVNVEPKTFYEDSFVSLKDLWRTLIRAWSTRAGPAVSAAWPSLSLLFGSWSGDADIVHSTEQPTKKGRKKPKKVDEAPTVAGGTKMNRVTWSIGGQVAAALSGALDAGTWTKTLKKVKKAWGASRAVSATHELLVDAFDLLWAPVDWLGNLDSTWAAWTKSEKPKKKKKKY